MSSCDERDGGELGPGLRSPGTNIAQCPVSSVWRLHDADIRLNRDPATTTSADTSLSNTVTDVQTQVKSLHYDWQLVNEDGMFSVQVQVIFLR